MNFSHDVDFKTQEYVVILGLTGLVKVLFVEFSLYNRVGKLIKCFILIYLLFIDKIK